MLTDVTVTGDRPPSDSTSASGVDPQLWVLTLSAVKSGIGMLQGLRIHEQFPAYLHLRQRALETGAMTDIDPIWNHVGDLLKMPGGPANKPNYRPWSSRKVKDPSGFWLNKNLAGSFAPSSARTISRFMLNAAGDGFALPADHAQHAFASLLKGERVPAWAFAAYYLRNYGFRLTDAGGHDDLIDGFKREFFFANATDFEILFDDTEPDVAFDWFEPHRRPDTPDHADGADNA